MARYKGEKDIADVFDMADKVMYKNKQKYKKKSWSAQERFYLTPVSAIEDNVMVAARVSQKVRDPVSIIKLNLYLCPAQGLLIKIPG